ncbi:hypothetical protein [Thermodesulfobacterium commune]|nr:hypothetical protein [Thermodesulfobacterium commune]
MPQNFLNFKILRTNENLTALSGLALVDGHVRAIEAALEVLPEGKRG